MSKNILNLDLAMNMIKENLLRDLSDSVIKTSTNSSYNLKQTASSEKNMD